MPHLRRSSRLALALSLLAGLGFSGAAPARAVETLALKLPVIGELITARVSELKSQQALWAGDSDLAELNRATNGRIAAAIWELVHTPMPTVDYQGSAMVQQTEVMLSQLLEIDQQQASALHGRPLAEALQRLRSNGQTASLVNVLAEVPARKVVIRLDWAVPRLRDLQREQRALKARLAALPPLAAAPASSLRPGAQPVTTTVSQIPLPGGADRLEVTVVRPTGTPTLPPVVISHGLWDSPASFLGWARHLASHGAPVFLPRHPGSDLTQQAEMLAGRMPPPDPREFLRRPADVRAVLDALDAGTLRGGEGIRAKGVVMIGHSWGATTALQLAGARSLQDSRWQECADDNDPQRNISWVLQCSFLPAATPES
ncbi:MAG: alpha/beta hydrolase family protein, partial [Cyanobium sp.]